MAIECHAIMALLYEKAQPPRISINALQTKSREITSFFEERALKMG